MNELTMYTALPYILHDGPDEIPLGEGISLIRPTPALLDNRMLYAMNEHEYGEEAKATRYLICKYPYDIDREPTRQNARDRFYSGLMAMQIIKPVQTLGFIYTPPGVEHRSPMDAGPWARMGAFTEDMLAKVPTMIPRVRAVFESDNAERKNAITLLQLGLENFHEFMAGLLWVMGLEAIFDSRDRNDFKRKLCACLGPKTLAFPDWNPHTKAPQHTVEEIALDLYMLRSKLAHGADFRKAMLDKTNPVDFTKRVQLTEYGEPIPYAYVLSEAACYLLCQVLDRVL